MGLITNIGIDLTMLGLDIGGSISSKKKKNN